MRLFLNKMSYADFWKWFGEHSQEYLRLETDQNRLVNQLAKQLGKADPLLSFMIGPFENNQRELFISCDGIRKEAPRVCVIVAAAPQIPGWKITAFKPPISIETAEYKGLEMAVADVYFSSRPVEDGYIDLVIFMTGYKAEEQNKYMGLAFIILDSVIGEEGVMTKLRKIQFADLEQTDRSKLQPIQELARIIKKHAN